MDLDDALCAIVIRFWILAVGLLSRRQGSLAVVLPTQCPDKPSAVTSTADLASRLDQITSLFVCSSWRVL